MDIKEALQVANDFHKYLQTGDQTKINQYKKSELNSALALFQPHDRNQPWYQEVVRRKDFLERAEEQKLKDKWYQRPLFVGITSAIVAGIFALLGGYKVGVENTVNNVPIQSNNRQIGNIYAQQIIFNENGTFQINGTALNQATGSTIKFRAISQDVVTVPSQDPSEVTAAFNKINNSK